MARQKSEDRVVAEGGSHGPRTGLTPPDLNDSTHSGGQGPEGISDGARWSWSAAVMAASR